MLFEACFWHRSFVLIRVQNIKRGLAVRSFFTKRPHDILYLNFFYSLLKHCNQRVLDKVREISVWRLGDYKFRSISLRLCPVASPRIDFIRPRIDHVSTRGLLKRLSVRNFLSNLIIDLPTYFPSSIVVIEL